MDEPRPLGVSTSNQQGHRADRPQTTRPVIYCYDDMRREDVLKAWREAGALRQRHHREGLLEKEVRLLVDAIQVLHHGHGMDTLEIVRGTPEGRDLIALDNLEEASRDEQRMALFSRLGARRS